MIYTFERRDWQKPENMYQDYIPPKVEKGKISAEGFWVIAVHNTKIEIRELEEELKAARIRLLHAQGMFEQVKATEKK